MGKNKLNKINKDMSNVGSLLSISSSLTSVVGIAASFIVFKLGAQYVKVNSLTPNFYAYAGDIVALLLSQLAAAYAGVKTIDAAVGGSGSFKYYYQYAHKSDLGNWLGLYELLATLFFLTWTLGISILGYVEADMMWVKFEDMQKAGTTMTLLDGYKYLALGFIIGIGAWISGLALGDSCEELLGWYDNYNVGSEATNQNGVRDSDGTSIVYDLSYHTVTLLYTYAAVSAIAVGGFVFGYLWLGNEVSA